MISGAVLERAVADGLITSGQAARLRALAAEASAPEPAGPEPDREKLRFVSGFGDIFVTIGIGLVLYAATLLIIQTGYGAAAFAAAAALSWALAEFFVRRRRMAFPGIVLLLAFLGAVALAAGAQFRILEGFALLDAAPLDLLAAVARARPIAASACAAIVVLAGAAHYARFRVPITVAAAAAGLVGFVVLLAAFLRPDLADRLGTPLLLLCGLGCFGLAMRFDLADPARRTRNTDIAFWLHLLAAPLVVHSLFAMVGAWALTPRQAVFVLSVFLLLSVVAIVVDRRALLVSGLVYAAFAFGHLFQTVGLGTQTFLVTALAMGALILLLSAGWQILRRLLLRSVPRGLARRLPDAAVATA